MESSRKMRRMDDAQIERESNIILKLLEGAPADVQRTILLQLDIVSLYRMCRINKRFEYVCNNIGSGKGIWKYYFLQRFVHNNVIPNVSAARIERFTNVIRAITREPTLYDEPENPINWLWVNLAWEVVSKLDMLLRKVMAGYKSKRLTQQLLFPRGLMVEGQHQSRYMVNFTLIGYSGPNPLEGNYMDHNWDRYDPRWNDYGVNTRIRFDTFASSVVTRKIASYVYRYTRNIDNVSESLNNSHDIIGYRRDEIARMVYAMLRDGFVYNYKYIETLPDGDLESREYPIRDGIQEAPPLKGGAFNNNEELGNDLWSY